MGDVLCIKSVNAGVTCLFNRLGQVVKPIRYEEGLTEVRGLPKGVYAIGGKLVLIR